MIATILTITAIVLLVMACVDKNTARKINEEIEEHLKDVRG